MTQSERPLAIATVRFETAISGRELAGLVQQVATNKDGGGFPCTHYIEEWRGPHVSLGQTSMLPYKQLRVVGSLDGPPYFGMRGLCREVIVASHPWPTTTVLGYSYVPEDFIDAVEEFASRLQAAYMEVISGEVIFPEYVSLSDQL